MEKEKGTIKCSSAVLVIGIFAVLGFVSGYASRKQSKIECPKSIVNINEVADKVKEGSVSNNFEIKREDDNYVIVEKRESNFFDASELSVKILDGYTVFKDISNNENIIETIEIGKNYYAKLDINGKVYITNFKNDVKGSKELNINNVLDIIEFTILADEPEQLLYLLTEDGSVYSYRIGNSDNMNYDVERVVKVSNAKRLFISNYAKPDADSTWGLFAITENNECIMINATGV